MIILSLVSQRRQQKRAKNTKYRQTIANTKVQDNPRRSNKRRKGEKSDQWEPQPNRGGDHSPWVQYGPNVVASLPCLFSLWFFTFQAFAPLPNMLYNDEKHALLLPQRLDSSIHHHIHLQDQFLDYIRGEKSKLKMKICKDF